jgi:mRNA-degrading endonuclease toxin of MazEF toxin-antitoxin module
MTHVSVRAGHVLLIDRFPFSDGRGAKTRPAVVVDSKPGRLIVAGIYSGPGHRRRPFRASTGNGLNRDGYVDLRPVEVHTTQIVSVLGYDSWGEFA